MRARYWLIAICAAAAAVHPRLLSAQTLSVSGNPSALIISTAVAGSAPTLVTNSTTTYSINGNLMVSAKIKARLSAALPAGMTLKIMLQAPGSGTSTGWVTLTTTDQAVVTGVPIGSFSNLLISYELSCVTAAGVVAMTSQSVTLTLSAL